MVAGRSANTNIGNDNMLRLLCAQLGSRVNHCPSTCLLRYARLPASDRTLVTLAFHVVHRDPRYFFPHPDSFRPERWLEPQRTESKLELSAYFPFSYGSQVQLLYLHHTLLTFQSLLQVP
jgi:hypothetical protein